MLMVRVSWANEPTTRVQSKLPGDHPICELNRSTSRTSGAGIVTTIEPVGQPSTWQEQLDKHGDSLHHLAFRLRDVDEMMEQLPSLEARGLKLVQRGDWLPKGRYLYLDGLEKLGLVLELLPGRSS